MSQPNPAQVATKVRHKNHITVLLFKDNLTARAFEVPLRWMSRVGVLLCVGVLLTLVSTLVAGKYYLSSLKTNPAHVEDLEQELSQLRSTLHDFELKANGVNPGVSPSPSSLAGLPADQKPDQKSEQKVEARPLQKSGSGLGFSAFPASVNLDVPEPDTLSFAVKSPKAYWVGKTLKVRFYLQYTKGDEGSQQGKILIVTRGSDLLMSYPTGALNLSGNDALLSPERGEFFSVSRYREVKADFVTPNREKTVQEVEIYLFSKSDHLLFYEKLTPTSQRPRATESETSESEPESSSQGDSNP